MLLFLSILKIIGIVLLVALGIVLLLLIILLFAPIRYKAYGCIDEKDPTADYSIIKDRIHLKAGFTYLCNIVRGGIDYPDLKEFTIKVLFFTVYPNRKSENLKESSEEKEDHVDLPTEMEEGFDDAESKTSDNEVEEHGKNDDSLEKSSEVNDLENEISETDSENSAETDENEEYKETGETDEFDAGDENDISFFEVVNGIFETISELIRIPQNVFSKIKCTISSICAKIDMIKNTIENDIFKRAFEVTKKQVLRVLRMIVPKKCRINILVGMDDPTATADIFAAYGIFYPILMNKVYMQPEFERSVIAGTVYIKGKIRLITILWAVAVLYFNKDVKKTFRRFKRIIKS